MKHPTFKVTLFPSLSANTCEQVDTTFTAFCNTLTRKPSMFERKADMPLFCPMAFDGTRTLKGALRHDAAVTEIFGVCGDHDAGTMTPEDARDRLKHAGVDSFIYTTPSHTPDKPRWRVVAQFAAPTRVHAEHTAAVERLNHLLDGGLKTESFTLSQSFYYGCVRGVPYQTYRIKGRFIDTLTDLPRRGKSATVANGVVTPSEADDSELMRRIVSGEELHPSMVALSARLAGRNYRPEDIASSLQGLVLASQAEPERLAARLAEIPRIVESAMQKFSLPAMARGPHLTLVKPQPADTTLVDHLRAWAPYDPATVPPVAFYVDQLIETRRCVGLVAPGGTGKTTALLQLAIATALGGEWYDLKVERGRFVLLSLDDLQEDLTGALEEVMRAMKLSSAQQFEVRNRVRLFSLLELPINLSFAVETQGGTALETRLREDLQAALGNIPELRCVALDTLAQFAGGDTNSARVMTIATRAVSLLAVNLQCACIVPHHMTKAGARANEVDQYSGAGSAAFGNNLRVILVMTRVSVEEMELSLALDPLVRAGLHEADIIKLSDTRGSLRRKTLAPIWIARVGFELRRINGRAIGLGEREEILLEKVVQAVRTGATSLESVRERLKMSAARVREIVALALVKNLIFKNSVKGPLKAK